MPRCIKLLLVFFLLINSLYIYSNPNNTISNDDDDELHMLLNQSSATYPSCSIQDNYWMEQSGDDFVSPSSASESSTVLQSNSLQGQKDGVYFLDGEVTAYKNNQTLQANWLMYNQNTSHAIGEKVTLTQQYNVMTGEWIDYYLDLNSGVLTKATAKDNKTDLYVAGDSIVIYNKDEYRANNSFFTSCDINDPAWHFTAKTTDIDNYDSQGTSRDATFYVDKLPVAYTPYLQFPMGKRRSGFLIPEIGSLNSSSYTGANLFVGIPYYWNMAPNYDMTIDAKFYSLSGFMATDDFRYLTDSSKGEIYTEQLPSDMQTHEYRYYWHMLDDTTLTKDWTTGYTFNSASDNNYFVDFGNANSFADNINLERSAYIRYKPSWGLFDAKMQGYQTLNPSNQPAAPAIYSSLPQINFNVNPLALDDSIFKFNLNSQLTLFRSGVLSGNILENAGNTGVPSPLQDGDRLVIYPSLTTPFTSNWGYITPKFGYNYTDYILSPYAGFYPDGAEVSREIPITSIDSGLYFDKSTNWFNSSITQTLEPRLYYLYIPQINQANLPVFDTAVSTPNLNQLFSENRFSGYDRVNSDNDITMGLNSRILNSDTGLELANWGVGYRYYVTPSNNLLYGSYSQYGQLYQPMPNLIAELNNNWGNHISTSGNFQYDTLFNVVDGYMAQLNYNPELHKVINLKYSYQYQMPIFFYSWSPSQGYSPVYTENQYLLDVSGQWNLFSDNWLVDGRFNYDLTRGQRINSLGGIEYNGGCWSLAFLYEQFATNATTNNGQYSTQSAYTQAYLLQFTLRGLGNGVGSGDPASELKQNIPGYAPVTTIR